METKVASNFWWMKGKKSDSDVLQDLTNKNRPDEEISTSLAEYLEKERELTRQQDEDLNNVEEVDIGSILEEISRLSAKSPLGPYEKDVGDRSIEDIMREAEKIYLESSKSFEQLSQHSKTSQNISALNSENSTPTPKSLSPLPLDDNNKTLKSDSEMDTDNSSVASEVKDEEEEQKYSTDFDSGSSKETVEKVEVVTVGFERDEKASSSSSSSNLVEVEENVVTSVRKHQDIANANDVGAERLVVLESFKEEIEKKDEMIKLLIVDNHGLKEDIKNMQTQIDETKSLFEQANAAMKAQTLKSPEINIELEKALEELKDTKEINTALQLQLDSTNKSHQSLKYSYEELLGSNKQLERRVLDIDNTLAKYKYELLSSQQTKEKLLENEAAINKLLDIEKMQVKSLKLQTEKDGKCIMDLNRQIKEMERIIARKHPDSVSALIVAAKKDVIDCVPSARKLLEDRIKVLEQEALLRDTQNSQVFIDVQEKFNQMKLKYENHIEDLELHVNDLKLQLKRKVDTYDVYTQTFREDQKIPEKDKSNVSIQTEPILLKTVAKHAAAKKSEDAHLIATIRGLQNDLANKEKVSIKLQREIDELRKTNRRLQKEREGSLKNLSEKKVFRSYPESLASRASSVEQVDTSIDELRALRTEREKMRQQLCRIEEDYQALKTKRLQDLNTLQEAHEREVAAYLGNITPLREQLDVQQVTVSNLQKQLIAAKEQLAVTTVERDHLNERLAAAVPDLQSAVCTAAAAGTGDERESEIVALKKKIYKLETKYEEREHRLRAIVHGLAQKNVSNRSCEQCSARQQQLIGYKVELDQLIATLRNLQ